MSELYASMLMLAVTVSLGSVVTAMATNQYGQSSSSAGLSASLQDQAAGVQVSYVTDYVSVPASCPSYGGAPEGTVLSVTVFDFGTTGFTPDDIVVNSTTYFGTYAALAPGSMATYSVQLAPSGTCAHPSGQTLLLSDAIGDVVQVET